MSQCYLATGEGGLCQTTNEDDNILDRNTVLNTRFFTKSIFEKFAGLVSQGMNDMLSELNGHLELSFVLARLQEAYVDKVSKLSRTVGTLSDLSESEDDDSESATFDCLPAIANGYVSSRFRKQMIRGLI